MISSLTITNNLLLKVVFFTAKSARQTTPNLIKNPKLTKRGIMQITPKSYAYEVPQNIPNHHLYWDNTAQNRLRRKQYNSHKLYKLGVKSIHDDKGTPLHNRPIQQVLYQLSNLRLLKQSLGRALINLREIAQVYPNIMKQSDRDIVLWALDHIDSRNLASMNHYQFSTYCFLRNALKVPATKNLLIHSYKWIEGEVERPSGKFKPKYLLNNIKYVFHQNYASDFNDILFKKHVEFKLFEDLQPTNKPLQELLPRLFSDEQLKALKAQKDFKIEQLSFLKRIPGGDKLFDRIQKL